MEPDGWDMGTILTMNRERSFFRRMRLYFARGVVHFDIRQNLTSAQP